MADERMITRRNRPNYLILENGIDAFSEQDILSGHEEKMSEFVAVFQSEIDSSVNIPDNEILPSESASQSPAIIIPDPHSSIISSNAPLSRKRKRPAPATAWV
jgi:hypothetical protein